MGKEPRLSGEQCRAARLSLSWTESDLAERAGIAVLQVIRFEAGRKVARSDAAIRLRRALEEAGIRLDGAGADLPRLARERGR